MESLDKELNELKGFIAELKSDRQAQKDKEKRESWTKHTSLSIVFIAVLAAIATQWSGKYSSHTLVDLNNATFAQAQASDQWSYYQASSIKQNLYESIHEQSAKDTITPASLEAFNAKVAKYTASKEDSSKKAAALEHTRDEARNAADESSRRGGAMGLSVSIFQISIALGSICLVTKRKPLWYLSLFLAALATVQMIRVWLN